MVSLTFFTYLLQTFDAPRWKFFCEAPMALLVRQSKKWQDFPSPNIWLNTKAPQKNKKSTRKNQMLLLFECVLAQV